MPAEAVARGDRFLTVGRVVHRQVQGHEAVAVRRVGRHERVVAALRVRAAVPAEAVARGDGLLTVGGVVDRQVQGHDGVAARSVGKPVYIITGLCIGAVEPHKALARGFCNLNSHRHTGLDVLNPRHLFAIITIKSHRICDVQRLNIQHIVARLAGVRSQMQPICDGIQLLNLQIIIQ